MNARLNSAIFAQESLALLLDIARRNDSGNLFSNLTDSLTKT